MHFSTIVSLLTTSALATAIPAPAALAAPNPIITKVPLTPAQLSDILALTEPGANSTLSTREVNDPCYFQAFEGGSCNLGYNLAWDAAVPIYDEGKCVSSSGRHSFFLSPRCSGNKMKTLVYEWSKCGGGKGFFFELDYGCYAVNTGYDWQSTFVSR